MSVLSMMELNQNPIVVQRSILKCISNLVMCLLTTIITIYICYVSCIRYHFLFTWHVILGAISYILMMPLSLIIYDNVWFVKYTRKQKSWIHGILVFIATIIAIISVYVDYERKEIMNEQYNLIHFESPHAISGLISVVLYVFANASGIFAMNFKWIRENVVAKPIFLKLSHNMMGQFAYIIGMISIILVLHARWFVYYTTCEIRIIVTLLIIVVTGYSINNSIISAYYQIQSLRGL